MVTNSTNQFTISNNTMVRISDKDWEDLDSVIELQGFMSDALDNTRIAKGTIRSIHKNRMGQKSKISELMKYVRFFLDHSTKPAA